MNLHHSVKKIHRFEIEKELDNPTAKEVLDLLFGSWDGDEDRPYYKVFTYDYDHERTWQQRLNMFWAMPLTLLLSPIMYIYSGQVGWSDKSKVGKFILKVTGHLHE